MYLVEQIFIEDQCARHWVGHQHPSNEGIPISRSLHLLYGIFCLPKVLSRPGHKLLFEKQEKFQKSGAIHLPSHPPTHLPTYIPCVLVFCLHVVCKGVIPWNWNNRKLWAARWLLEIEPESSGRTASFQQLSCCSLQIPCPTSQKKI